MRVCFIVSYDGSRFQGSQQQPSKNTTILSSFIEVCKKLGIDSKPAGSGRTDKGVHANNQAIHLDIPHFWSDLERLKVVFNRHLHPFIHVKRVLHVSLDFHARYSVMQREYRYIISHDRASPLKSAYVFHYPKLDLGQLNVLLKLFIGTHNFSMFKKSGGFSKNPIRTISYANAYMYKKHTIIAIRANGFLRSQIRMIVSILLKANEGKLGKKEILEQLSCQKQHSFTLAPPNGLYLNRVYYDTKLFI